MREERQPAALADEALFDFGVTAVAYRRVDKVDQRIEEEADATGKAQAQARKLKPKLTDARRCLCLGLGPCSASEGTG